MVVHLDYPPTRIDIITEVDGVEFAPCWERHIEIESCGQRVPFISVEDLLTNKKASGRPPAAGLAAVPILWAVRRPARLAG